MKREAGREEHIGRERKKKRESVLREREAMSESEDRNGNGGESVSEWYVKGEAIGWPGTTSAKFGQFFF